VDVVGIANFRTFLENTGPYRRKWREAEYGSLEEDAAFLEEISPVRHAEKIRAPLLVIQGANDPRVPPVEAEQIVAAVRENGGRADYLLYEDEGHGVVKLTNRIHAYEAIVQFLEEHGR
jgi:dipeptidyl aminopeptidase/acylaminoacyl peptidase